MPVSGASRAQRRRRSPTGAARRCSSSVDLRVEQGEFVAIAGPNGGGKTTLLRLIARAGAARPRATRCSSASPPPGSARRPRIGYLAQRAHAGTERPGHRPRARRGRPARRCAGSRPAAAADRAAVTRGDRARRACRPRADARCGRSPAACSSGRSSPRRSPPSPSLLVLDEPTTGVDAASQDSLAALLERAPRRARGHDPLRLARVRRGRARRRSGCCSSAAASPSTARRRPPGIGTTLPMSTPSDARLEFMRLALRRRRGRRRARACRRLLPGPAPASLVGDGIGHVAFAGVAAGYLLEISPA